MNELEDIRFDGYKSSKIYKERMKRWHDKHIHQREFRVGDFVILFNSRLNLLLGKIRLRCDGSGDSRHQLESSFFSPCFFPLLLFSLNVPHPHNFLSLKPLPSSTTILKFTTPPLKCLPFSPLFSPFLTYSSIKKKHLLSSQSLKSLALNP